MRPADFTYDLPHELIAQYPSPQRDGSRLMVWHRNSAQIEHQYFTRLPDYLRAGDVLILNNSRVIPARLQGTNRRTGGRFELLLIEEVALNDWWAMVRPGKRAPIGAQIEILDGDAKTTGICAQVTAVNELGHRRLTFAGTANIRLALDLVGTMPLPPYISRPRPDQFSQDKLRYQTVYARPPGSVAAPTAGLHFTPEILETIRLLGVNICQVTLHVGLGTFSPVKAETLESHVMHEEWMEIGIETANAIAAAKAAGNRVIAVGTTSVRVLESVAALNEGAVRPHQGKTSIFIYPPYRFRVVDALLTNFHLPRSTLLMLVAAFARPGEVTGREAMLAAYEEAIRNRYRFFSYGDAMLIL